MPYLGKEREPTATKFALTIGRLAQAAGEGLVGELVGGVTRGRLTGPFVTGSFLQEMIVTPAAKENIIERKNALFITKGFQLSLHT